MPRYGIIEVTKGVIYVAFKRKEDERRYMAGYMAEYRKGTRTFEFNLRLEDDEELIDYIDECRGYGHSYVDIVRGLYYGEPL